MKKADPFSEKPGDLLSPESAGKNRKQDLSCRILLHNSDACQFEAVRYVAFFITVKCNTVTASAVSGTVSVRAGAGMII